jgi:hypothetical protein
VPRSKTQETLALSKHVEEAVVFYFAFAYLISSIHGIYVAVPPALITTIGCDSYHHQKNCGKDMKKSQVRHSLLFRLKLFKN